MIYNKTNYPKLQSMGVMPWPKRLSKNCMNWFPQLHACIVIAESIVDEKKRRITAAITKRITKITQFPIKSRDAFLFIINHEKNGPKNMYVKYKRNAIIAITTIIPRITSKNVVAPFADCFVIACLFVLC